MKRNSGKKIAFDSKPIPKKGFGTPKEKERFFREAVLASFMTTPPGPIEQRVERSVSEATFLLAFVQHFNLDQSVEMARVALQNRYEQKDKTELGTDPTVLGSPEDYENPPEIENEGSTMAPPSGPMVEDLDNLVKKYSPSKETRGETASDETH